jgi:hypothetical protein
MHADDKHQEGDQAQQTSDPEEANAEVRGEKEAVNLAQSTKGDDYAGMAR